MGVIAEIVQSDYEIIYNCKSTHNRTSPLATEIQKMGYCRDLPHWVRHIPHRLRGGAVLNKLKLKGLMAFELQFVCGERGSRTYTFTEYHKTAND